MTKGQQAAVTRAANKARKQAQQIATGREMFRQELAEAKGDAFDAFQRKANEAFSLVANAENWKFAVDAVADVDAMRAGFVAEAVVFFTGSVPKVTRVAGGFRFQAAGYYAAVGA